MTITLTVSLIVRNEEQTLGRCLDSVQGLGDEIVVVDTGAMDGTRQVAARRGARVFDFPWCDDFAAARNETLRHATGRWSCGWMRMSISTRLIVGAGYS
jgi:glycosyltransferase involved in cell wall biosynthesis